MILGEGFLFAGPHQMILLESTDNGIVGAAELAGGDLRPLSRGQSPSF